MKEDKHFIFVPGIWLGEGNISFSLSPNSLRFAMRWTVKQEEKQSITCIQEIEIEEITERMCNTFVFSEIKDNSFQITLSNEILGKVHGKGVIDSQLFAWEFHDKSADFEGYEIFEKKDKENFIMRAEYSSKDQTRTTIAGSIWRKVQTTEGTSP